MKTIGLMVHVDRPLIKESAERIIRWSENNGLRCLICTDLAAAIGRQDISASESDIGKQCEAIVTLGGDGSILSSARAFGRYGISILGINLGKLGFLTEVAQNQIEDSLLRLKEDRFQIEQRMVLEAGMPSGENLVALNDVVVDHGGAFRLAKVDLFSDDEFVCPYDADGVIIASPTGSTAYSLSAGGPVIHPAMESIAVSPISPHTLALRTIIFPAASVLTLRTGSEDMRLRVALDGQVVGDLSYGQGVSVRKADYKLKLIKFDLKSYFEILRTKLNWGARPLYNS
jgi:NAD+ kinase